MKFNVWRIQNLVIAEIYDVTEEDTYESSYDDIRWDNYYASDNNLMYVDCGHFEITDDRIYYPIFSTERKVSLNRYSIVTEKNMSERFDKIINTLKEFSDVVNIKANIPIERNKDKIIESLNVHNVNGCQLITIKYGINTSEKEVESLLGHDNVMFSSDLMITYQNKTVIPEVYQSIERAELIVTSDNCGQRTAEMYDKSLETFLDLQKI